MLSTHAEHWRTCLSTSRVVFRCRSSFNSWNPSRALSKCRFTCVCSKLQSRLASPQSPNTPPLKFICRLLITELVNVPPPLFFSPPSQYTATLCCYPVSTFPLLPTSSSSPCSMIISPLSSSASLLCELMITVTKSTLVYKLPLWFRHQCYSGCVLLWFVELLCPGCISPPLVHSCLWVTWWPHRDLSCALIGGSVT